MRTFNLPDLGEGLPDAEIVEWHVAVGDHVEADQPMVSMETAKAVVEVPAPFSGVVAELHGAPGDVIDTGRPLVSFADAEAAAPADGDQETAAARPAPAGEESPASAAGEARPARPDAGTVVGAMEQSDRVVTETASRVGEFRVTPAVRALARKLGVDLGTVRASGKGGVITAGDVRAAAEAGPAAAPPAGTAASTPAPPPAAIGDWTDIRGPRRVMARAMAEAHASVVPTSITEEADLALWEGKQDVTIRLVRAMCAGARREPILNAWFDADGPRRLVHDAVHLGLAVDTEDGLFVSTLRDADSRTPAELRAAVDRLRGNVQNRSIPPEDLRGYTMILSNVGIYAGQYTTPVITPPCVAIMATGRMRQQVMASHGGMAVHPVMPLSLSFDHRCVTGGEAARFLAAFIEDLALPR